MNATQDRVIALYRVSTKKQVDVNDDNETDIPMQRKECTKFIDQKGWTLLDEYQEEGVSGYKTKSDDREVLQLIKGRAERGEFDILLVFMFDRIGRRASETPFVIEWFVSQGIQVWSTQEGQQKYDTDADHLMSYIRSWQSEGESKKTSIRTKTALGQIVEDGYIKGGLAPYGYRYEKSGRFNKRQKELLKLVVDDFQAEIVRSIFKLYVTRGFGAQRIASSLNEGGVMNASGKCWHPASIRGMLKNMTYNGVLRCGESRSEQMPELVIIDDDTFKAAQELIDRRKDPSKHSFPIRTEARGLLSGNVFCGHCGARLSKTSSVKKGSNGKQTKRFRYTCYGTMRKQTDCDGPTGYTMHRLDDVIREIAHCIFDTFGSVGKGALVGDGHEQREKALKAEQKKVRRDLDSVENKLQALNLEIVNTLTGDSAFSKEQLSTAIDIHNEKRKNLQHYLGTINIELADLENLNERLEKKYDQVIGWAKMFDDADCDVQQMIVSQLIDKVSVYKGYELDIKFNVDIECFNMLRVQMLNTVEQLRYTA